MPVLQFFAQTGFVPGRFTTDAMWIYRCKEDYYKSLGVSRTATTKEIKSAYRKLAMDKHPDRVKGDKKEAEAEFSKITEAYEVLSNTEKRRLYDLHGHTEPQMPDTNFRKNFYSFNDMFESFFDGDVFGNSGFFNHDDMFGSFHGGLCFFVNLRTKLSHQDSQSGKHGHDHNDLPIIY
ncbi:chaperone protein DnaJ-like [Octopus sinensis]|uniref:Chaperone protein DnaJ-like n=1 Tax=Octopus sinensis TaxID=2607531 RepID=A0A6P7U0J1_9MOLL|nr:chaperone protein DnaJ-like [Octopus sinensis]